MKSILYHSLWLALLAIFSSTPVLFAQSQLLNTPYSSPKAVSQQTIGLTDISVTYYRPAVKDREIFGQLVAYGSIWRAGANYNTVLTISDDIKVAGKELKAGSYGLHLIPEKDKATLILSHNTAAWGSFSYNPKQTALQEEIKVTTTDAHYEHLTFAFENLEKDRAVLALNWANTKFIIPVEVDLEQSVLASIRSQLQTKPGWSWQGWNEAANYCLVNNMNHEEALTWAQRSVFMNPTPQNIITKAKLSGKVKAPDNEEKAVKVALTSLDKDLESAPCTWKEWNAAANFAVQAKQYDKAVAWSEKAVNMSPNMTSLMAHAGIQEARGEKEKAEMMRKKAIEKGSNAELNNYGYQLLQSGKAAKAVEVFEANAHKNPKDPNVWDSLGEGYLNNGQKEKAIESFKKSLSMNPPANVKANSMKLLK